MKLVKVCGIKTKDIAKIAIDNGANLVGMIMLRGVKRSIDLEECKAINNMVKHHRKYSINDIVDMTKCQSFDSVDDMLSYIKQLIMEHGPFTVGVFRNQSVDEILQLADDTGIDIIQLHGSEDKLSYIKQLGDAGKVVIPRYVIPDEIDTITSTLAAIFRDGKYYGHGFLLPLLDGEMGGTGKQLDWSVVSSLHGRFILAGGLNHENVTSLTFDNLLGFDVSGGVETDGVKDADKVIKFIKAGKSV